MSAPRIRRIGTAKEMENMIDDYITQGYEVLTQGQTTAMVRKKTWGSGGGHALWGLLTIWFTFGLGNVGYALFAHYNAEQVLLKLEEV